MNGTENDCLCHVAFRTSSRANSYSAKMTYEYINRLANNSKKEDLIYTNSINMPTWASSNPEIFWQKATELESFKGRQAVNINIALPYELSIESNIALINEFAEKLTCFEEGKLPCSVAYHYEDKTPPNPHFHMMIYERPVNNLTKNIEAERFF